MLDASGKTMSKGSSSSVPQLWVTNSGVLVMPMSSTSVPMPERHGLRVQVEPVLN